MPRIDPLKLLTCLKVLLASNGGIRSEHEVKRLAGLMTKYSKKLVSKCIYIQILKCTNTELLGAFMGSGGWTLTHMWLSDGIQSRNWPLVQEILELLLLCPVDTHRLRSNTAPKLVKTLCQTGGNEGVRILATKLVEQWLKVVKEESVSNTQMNNTSSVVANMRPADVSMESRTSSVNNNTALEENHSVAVVSKTAIEEDPLAIPTANAASSLKALSSPISQRNNSESTLVYHIVMKDGKQVLAKIENSTNSSVADNADKLYEEEGNKNEKQQLEDQLKDASNKENEKHKKEQDGKEDKESSKDKDKSRNSRDKDKDKHRDSKSSHRTSSSKSKNSSSSSSKSKASSSHRSSTDSKNRDKDTDKSDSDRDKDRNRSSSSKSSSSSKDRHRDKDRSKEREKSKAKDKEKEGDSEKDVHSKIALPSIDKLGKIPKKPKDDTKTTPTSITIPSKKASISIEFRRDADRPKTVKTYKSQFRSHGLSEEAPPPPSRKGLKKPSSQTVPGTSIPPNISSLNLSLKRSSPPPQPVSPGSSPSSSTKDAIVPAEKKLKLDIIGQNATAVEKQGGIKLIPIKPKPPTLVESDLFMDALSASAVLKKDAKKRKRRSSASKESTKESSASSPPESPMDTSPTSKLTPLKFYQDTLEEKDDDKIESSEESKEDKDEKKEDEDDIPLKKVKESIDEKVRQEKEEEELRREMEDETSEPIKKPPGPGCGPDGPPGVLMMHRRKGPKKKLSWRPQEDLEEVRYFELDETERVNVTKTFTDMKQMERFNEREAFMMARKLNCEDLMSEQTSWMPLVLIDDVPPHPEGSQSREKKIQAERELTTLKALYFNRHMIPDSASEPDMDIEQYQKTEPAVIPLDDITGNPDAVNDFTNMPWPEPKGAPPQGIPDEFNAVKNAPMQNPPFNPFMQFGQPGWPMGGPGGPGAPGGMVPPGGPGGPMGSGMPPNNMLPPPQIMGGPMGGPMGGFNNMNMGPPNMNMGPPNMMMDHDEMAMNNMNMMQQPFHPPGPNFGGPPNNFNNFAPHHPPPLNMEMGPPPNMNMNNGPRGNNRVGGNWRSGASGPPPANNNNPGNWRPQGPPVNNRNNWIHGNPRICKQFQRGYCRNGNKCNYLHPPANTNY